MRSKPAVAVADLPPSRREANKREKLTRIRRAAREIFLRKGFEAATIREISAAADVAFGTLFLYAKDKQDLLLLLFEDEVPVLTERAFRKAKPDLPFVDQLIAFFAEYYYFFNVTPQLSRDMLREVTFSTGIVARRMAADIQNIERYIARLVARAQAEGHVNSSIAPDVAAHVLFSLYRIEVRFCLSEEEPDIRGSLHRLRREFEVVCVGMTPRAPVGAREHSSSLTRDRTPRRARDG